MANVDTLNEIVRFVRHEWDPLREGKRERYSNRSTRHNTMQYNADMNYSSIEMVLFLSSFSLFLYRIDFHLASFYLYSNKFVDFMRQFVPIESTLSNNQREDRTNSRNHPNSRRSMGNDTLKGITEGRE